MPRLFVGLPLPPDMQQSLSALCCGVPNMRWVQPHTLHITLCFIGDVDHPTAQEVDFALSHIWGQAFSLPLGGFGTFGRKRPDHLWVGVQHHPSLMDLAQRVETAIGQMGLPQENRKYTPHITLGRSHQCQAAHLAAFFQQHEPFTLPDLWVDRFVLFRSDLTRHGAEYSALAEYSLLG